VITSPLDTVIESGAYEGLPCVDAPAGIDIAVPEAAAGVVDGAPVESGGVPEVGDAAESGVAGVGSAGGGADTGGGILAVKSQLDMVMYPRNMRGMIIIINPFMKRAGDVLVMWVSSCVVIVIFNSMS